MKIHTTAIVAIGALGIVLGIAPPAKAAGVSYSAIDLASGRIDLSGERALKDQMAIVTQMALVTGGTPTPIACAVKIEYGALVPADDHGKAACAALWDQKELVAVDITAVLLGGSATTYRVSPTKVIPMDGSGTLSDDAIVLPDNMGAEWQIGVFLAEAEPGDRWALYIHNDDKKWRTKTRQGATLRNAQSAIAVLTDGKLLLQTSLVRAPAAPSAVGNDPQSRVPPIDCQKRIDELKLQGRPYVFCIDATESPARLAQARAADDAVLVPNRAIVVVVRHRSTARIEIDLGGTPGIYEPAVAKAQAAGPGVDWSTATFCTSHAGQRRSHRDRDRDPAGAW